MQKKYFARSIFLSCVYKVYIARDRKDGLGLQRIISLDWICLNKETERQHPTLFVLLVSKAAFPLLSNGPQEIFSSRPSQARNWVVEWWTNGGHHVSYKAPLI